MKTTFKWLIPVVLLIALMTVVAMPAMAQGPVTPPAPTGKTANDPLPLSCDWAPVVAAPAPGYYSDVFYKVPYAMNTQLVIYMWALTKSNPDNFRFEVYTPYDASLRYLFDERTVTTWDNWVGQSEGRSMPNKYELGDLSWSGKLNNGALDSYYIVDVLNFTPSTVWFNLCSRNYPNFR